MAGLALKANTCSIQEVNVRILECLKLLKKQQQERGGQKPSFKARNKGIMSEMKYGRYETKTLSPLQPIGYSLLSVFGSIPGSSCVAVTSCITFYFGSD